MGFEVKHLELLPVHALCFVLKAEDASFQLPAPAAVPAAIPARHDGFIPQSHKHRQTLLPLSCLDHGILSSGQTSN